MGKIKHDDSDNQMDVQDDNVMEMQNVNKTVKKNKKIVKNKELGTNQSKGKSNKISSSDDLIKHAAKMVNLKKKQRSLTEKQQIFKKIVKGLHGQKASKRQKSKSRVMMRRELHKALMKQQKAEPKVTESTMQSQKCFVQKKKKQPLDQKAQVLKMRSAMGQSLSSLKSMLAQKLN